MSKEEQREKLVNVLAEAEKACPKDYKAWREAEKACEKAYDAWEYAYDTLIQFDKEN